MQLDLGLLKVQFEIFGESADELAEQYGVSQAMMSYVIEKHGFRKLPVAASAREWLDKEVVDESLLTEVRHKLDILQTIKKATLSPRYVAIEATLLTKIQKLLDSIDLTEPGAASRVKDVASTFLTLREDTMGKEVDQPNRGGLNLQINIMGQVPPDYVPSTHPQLTIETVDVGRSPDSPPG